MSRNYYHPFAFDTDSFSRNYEEEVMSELKMGKEYQDRVEEMERNAMIETITEQEQTIELLMTAIRWAVKDPANWRSHLQPALDEAEYQTKP